MQIAQKIEEQIKRLVASYPLDTSIETIAAELVDLQIKREQIKVYPVGWAQRFSRADIEVIEFKYDYGDLSNIIFKVDIQKKINQLLGTFPFDYPLIKLIEGIEELGISKNKINIIPGGSLKHFSLKDLDSISKDNFILDEKGEFKQIVLRLKTENWIQELIGSYPLDISAEVIVAELIEQGIDYRLIKIYPSGLFKRFYNKDVGEVNFTYNEMGELARINVGVNREGIYDSLPEILFHQPAERKPFKSKERMKEESYVLREEEKAARLFFRPIEETIYHHRVMLELEERSTIRNFASDEIKEFWNFPDFLSIEDIATLTVILPIATRIVGKADLVALCLQAILREKVSIKINTLSKVENTREEKEPTKLRSSLALGEVALGVDTVVMGEFEEGIPTVSMQIGPVGPESVMDVLPQGNKDVLLNWVQEYFFPVEWEVETNVIINYDDFRPAKLGDPRYALGYSFVI